MFGHSWCLRARVALVARAEATLHTTDRHSSLPHLLMSARHCLRSTHHLRFPAMSDGSQGGSGEIQLEMPLKEMTADEEKEFVADYIPTLFDDIPHPLEVEGVEDGELDLVAGQVAANSGVPKLEDESPGGGASSAASSSSSSSASSSSSSSPAATAPDVVVGRNDGLLPKVAAPPKEYAVLKAAMVEMERSVIRKAPIPYTRHMGIAPGVCVCLCVCVQNAIRAN